MGQDTTQIRADIEATRARMGETVEALGYKADVPSRVRDNVNERIESVKGTIGDAVAGTKNAVFGTAQSATDGASDAVAGSREAVAMALENPIGLALGALALGFLGGLLIPISEMERERIGPVREQLVDRAQGAMSEAVDAGKAVLNETLASVAQTVQTKGPEIAQRAVAGTPFEQQQSA